MTSDWIESEPAPISFPSAPFYGAPSRGAPRGRRQATAPRPDFIASTARSEGSTSTLCFDVPEETVGRIIGRGGANIREIESSTGARVRIDRDRHRGYGGGGGDVRVVIHGSASEQRAAKDKVDELSGIRRSGSGEAPLEFGSSVAVAKPRFDWAALHAGSAELVARKWEGLAPIVKEFYVLHPDVAGMSSQEVEDFRKINNNISAKNLTEKMKDRPIPNPIRTFREAFESYPDIMAELEASGFEKPTPIQCQAWPVIMQGSDLVGIAQTGTGKTLAFLLPAFIHIEGQVTPRAQRDGPTVLVLSPTRELALQIESEVKKYKYKGIRCVCVYGGGNRREQINIVSRGVEIVIATPGRLNDLLMSGRLSVRSVTYLVLDEADRMLDLGFEPQIRKILMDIRDDRQTIMTSATWPPEVRRMTDMYLTDPVQVNVGSLNLAAVHTVTQLVEMIGQDEKRERIITFISEMGENDKVIVFVGRKATADDVASDLSLQGYRIECIHGDRDQMDREQALEDFRTGYVKVLIATDVASRGLDVKDITTVINYDFPRNIEEYVHRVGRTGRAGRSGTSLTLMTREDWKHAQDLIDILAEASQVVSEELVGMAERYKEAKKKWGSDGGGRGRRFGGRGGRSFGHRGGFSLASKAW
ncbi:probable ATP-dependent RNA helicase DDX43 [Oscarella lobularis]|uniref:probable ATP-dependent RNA helicase DDX43 n=1 Tax=Oscarella lobularis TaxID=121494 RepID=UPI0033143223